jgi:NAD(P)-dependent dehydrogenase (short-subunit alcohol dehydrogenase family)
MEAQTTEQVNARVVVITGSARGIGRATAELLVGEGMRVVVADLDVSEARAVAGRLGRSAIAIEVDVSEPASFAGLLERTLDEFGRLDVLVNNAGVMNPGPLAAEPDEVTRRQVQVNLLGAIYGIKLAAPRMRARGGGHIVNVASTLGRMGMPGAATYCATKHAIIGLSEAARAELRGTGVEISVLLPHAVNTDLVLGFPDPGPGLRLCEPVEVAQAIARVLRQPRFDVYVPAGHRMLYRLRDLLPRRAKDRLGRELAARGPLGARDSSERAEYARRTFPNPD